VLKAFCSKSEKRKGEAENKANEKLAVLTLLSVLLLRLFSLTQKEVKLHEVFSFFCE